MYVVSLVICLLRWFVSKGVVSSLICSVSERVMLIRGFLLIQDDVFFNGQVGARRFLLKGMVAIFSESMTIMEVFVFSLTCVLLVR